MNNISELISMIEEVLLSDIKENELKYIYDYAKLILSLNIKELNDEAKKQNSPNFLTPEIMQLNSLIITLETKI